MFDDESRALLDQLRASEERLRASVGSTSSYACCWRIEPEGPLLDWANEAFLGFTGRTIEAWRALPSCLDVVCARDRARVLARVGALLAGKEAHGELQIQNDRGDVRALHVVARPIWNRARTRVVAVYASGHDVTEERPEQLMNEQILSGAHEGIIVIDRDYRYRFWNPRMEQMTGVPRAEVLGRTPWELFPFLRDTGLDALLKRALEGEEVISPDFPYQVSSTNQSGWAVQRMGPLRDGTGRVIGALVFVLDISERKRIEEQASRSRALLEAVVEGTPDAILRRTSRATTSSPTARRARSWASRSKRSSGATRRRSSLRRSRSRRPNRTAASSKAQSRRRPTRSW